MHEIAIAQRIAADKAILESAGYTVYVPSNLKNVVALMRETGRKAESAMLSMDNNDFTTANGVFLFLRKNEKIVAGARTKVVDLQDETFESHQRRAVQQWYKTSEDEIVSIAAPLNTLIRGKHIYVGELELRPEDRGSVKVTTAFIRLILAGSLLKWPDVTCAYCILPERHRRIAVDYGFNTVVRNAFQWKGPKPPGGRLHDWLVALSSREQLLHDLTVGYWGPSGNEPG